ncbi:MAG: NlpC/P60 family protein [Ilumatobacteraceae bacterium]
MRQLSVRRLLRAIPIAVATAVIVPAMTPAVVQAQSVDQQRQKVEDIVDELERLEQRALQIGEDYNDAIDTKSQLDVEITDAEARIAEQEAELARLRSNLSEMALRSFVGGGAAPLGPLFEDSENLNDALQREELAKVALSAGDVTTDQLDALVSEIEDERRALDKKREQAEQLADSLIDAKTETEKLTSQYTDARADAEAKLGQLLREEEERRARESALRIQQQAQAASTASSSSGGGGSTSGGSTSGGSTSGSSTSSGASSGSSGSSSGSSGSGGGFSAPAVSSRSSLAVQAALAQQGTPYRYATSTPGVGFDCSGLTAYAWGQAGVGLPHQSRAQFAATPRVPISQAQPGDLLFFYSPISHVSIYLGNGIQVHAPSTGKTVSTASVNWGKVVGVGRPG